MGDEHNFAMPPADEPILMGPPPTEDDAVFVGDVDTTGGAVEDTAAVMVPAPEDAGHRPLEHDSLRHDGDQQRGCGVRHHQPRFQIGTISINYAIRK